MSNPVLLVLGAGPGLGLAVARRFGADGYDVALVARSADTLAPLGAALGEAGVRTVLTPLDLKDAAAVADLVTRIGTEAGRIDVLHFNPSAYRPKDPLHLTADQLLDDLRLGVAPLLPAVQAARPFMSAGGRILVTGSAAADRPSNQAASLGVQKAAVRNLVISIDATLAPEGIRAVAVQINGTLGPDGPFSPGPSRTRSTRPRCVWTRNGRSTSRTTAEELWSQATTVVIGWDESAGRSSDEAARPRAISSSRARRPLPRCRCTAPAADPDPDALGSRPLHDHCPQPGVRGHSPADQDVVDALARRGGHCLAGEDVADRLLEAGRDVRHRHLDAVALLGLHPPRHRRLETREREVEAVPFEVASAGETAGEVDRDAVAARSGSVDVRPTREAEPQQAGDLVERLTSRVVDGRPERCHTHGDVLDPQEARVAAADQHRQARFGQRPVLELVDRHVGREVVDAVDRLAEPDRQRFRRGHTDEQCPGEPGAARDRYRVDVVQLDAGGPAGSIDGRHHGLEVRTAGHLGYDAPEPRVLLDTARHRIGQQRVPPHDPHPGFVTGISIPSTSGPSMRSLCRGVRGRGSVVRDRNGPRHAGGRGQFVSDYRGWASRMDIRVPVSMTRVRRRPAAWNRAAYSFSLRSRPPGITSMVRSENAASTS